MGETDSIRDGKADSIEFSYNVRDKQNTNPIFDVSEEACRRLEKELEYKYKSENRPENLNVSKFTVPNSNVRLCVNTTEKPNAVEFRNLVERTPEEVIVETDNRRYCFKSVVGSAVKMS